MKTRELQWINTPVLIEAIIRYKNGNLHRTLKLWVEKVLEINPSNKSELLNS
tara:strand:+ start:52 stop:207 length:156 start_codon:yes stop_codon:yes gene_type:complete